MEQYRLKFWFEHGGNCIWASNDKANAEYGYAINSNSLPISNELVSLLNSLENEFYTYLDWVYPPNPSPWSEDHKKDFIDRATVAYNNLCKELGEIYIIENDVASCVV